MTFIKWFFFPFSSILWLFNLQILSQIYHGVVPNFYCIREINALHLKFQLFVASTYILASFTLLWQNNWHKQLKSRKCLLWLKNSEVLVHDCLALLLLKQHWVLERSKCDEIYQSDVEELPQKTSVLFSVLTLRSNSTVHPDLNIDPFYNTPSATMVSKKAKRVLHQPWPHTNYVSERWNLRMKIRGLWNRYWGLE